MTISKVSYTYMHMYVYRVTLTIQHYKLSEINAIAKEPMAALG